MSLLDPVFRIVNFAWEAAFCRNLLSNPATYYPLPQPVIHSRNLLSTPATCYPLPQPVIRSRNLLTAPATSYPLIKSLESQKKIMSG